MANRVVVLGGGVGGLSAAQELAERGFEVEVFESKPAWGGKARSLLVPGTGKEGRQDLPGEHGFRFFPSFCKHLPDTMKRILSAPTRTGSSTTWFTPAGCKLPAWLTVLASLFTPLGIPDAETTFFVDRLLVLLTTCPERRLAEYENIACGGTLSTPRIGPWVRHLIQLGVKLHATAPVGSINLDDGSVRTVTVELAGRPAEVTADYYVAAVPVEVISRLVTNEIRTKVPSLANVEKLETRWMNGIQFYFGKDMPLIPGHVNFVDSPWALTSISQHQFWTGSTSPTTATAGWVGFYPW